MFYKQTHVLFIGLSLLLMIACSNESSVGNDEALSEFAALQSLLANSGFQARLAAVKTEPLTTFDQEVQEMRGSRITVLDSTPVNAIDTVFATSYQTLTDFMNQEHISSAPVTAIEVTTVINLGNVLQSRGIAGLAALPDVSPEVHARLVYVAAVLSAAHLYAGRSSLGLLDIVPIIRPQVNFTQRDDASVAEYQGARIFMFSHAGGTLGLSCSKTLYRSTWKPGETLSCRNKTTGTVATVQVGGVVKQADGSKITVPEVASFDTPSTTVYVKAPNSAEYVDKPFPTTAAD